MRTVLLAGLVAIGTFPVFAQDDDINWLGSYPEALRVAKETGKPIFLEYRCEP